MAEFVDWGIRVNLLPQLVSGQWTTITLSPPAGATVAMLRFIGTPDISNLSKGGICRRIGDTTYDSVDRRIGYYLGAGNEPKAHASIQYAELTANQIEVYYDGAVDEVYVIGWLTASELQMFDGVSLQDYIVETPVANTWLTLDLTSIPGASTASAVLVCGTAVTGSAQNLNFRADETGTIRNFGTNSAGSSVGPTPLVNGVCQVYIANDVSRRIMLRGLFGPGFVALPITQEFIPTASGAWFDYTALEAPEGATGVLYHFPMSNSIAANIHAQGQPETPKLGFDLTVGGHVFPVSGRTMRAFASNTWPRPIVSGWFRPTSPTVVVDNVNGNNVIVRGGPIVINGQFPESGVVATLGGHPLTVTGVTSVQVTCAPLDVFATPLAFGSHTLTVDASATDHGIASVTPVELVIDTEHQVVTLTSVTPPLLAEGLAAGIGDQLACPATVGNTALLLTSDGDVVYWPAMFDGKSHLRYWYDGSTWDSGPVIINGGPAPGVPSISMFTVLTDTTGEATLKGKTDTTSGTVYAIVDANPTQPTKEQVRNGLNAAGAPALGKGSASVTTTDLAVTITGLPSDTLLYGWLAQWV